MKVQMGMMAALLLALPLLTACEADVKSDAAADSTRVNIDEFAGDKTRMADLMRQSFLKGTFDDALAMAMKDSMLAIEVAGVMKQYPGLLAEEPAATKQTVAGSTARQTSARTTSSRTTTQRNDGDVLDKTERTVKDANEKIDQAGRIKKEAEEAKRKVEDIFKP